jgi:epoxyqueuosine reductase QueG
MGLDDLLRSQAESLGADFYGVADLAPACEAILDQGGAVVAGYPRAVSIGVGLFHAIVDQLPQRAEKAVAQSYKHHCYDVINARLDEITSRLSSRLQREGHRAQPVPASKMPDAERLCGQFSHKMAAHLAGLGWIGKSCLLVTPEIGPRVRWATVLTDAPLAAGSPLEVRCGDCDECVRICPVQAFTGRAFCAEEPREARYDARRCDRYFESMREAGEDPAVCGLCLYACPWGKK